MFNPMDKSIFKSFPGKEKSVQYSEIITQNRHSNS